MLQNCIKFSFPVDPHVNRLGCILLDGFHALTNIFLYNFVMTSFLACCLQLRYFYLTICHYHHPVCVRERAISFFSMCMWYSFLNTAKVCSCTYASLCTPVFPRAIPRD